MDQIGGQKTFSGIQAKSGAKFGAKFGPGLPRFQKFSGAVPVKPAPEGFSRGAGI